MEERDFGTVPILKLFFKCTIPAMVGMAFSTIYYIIDGIFVGHFIGHEALAAVNLVMPLLMIITALAEMVATGSAVRISILLGQDNEEEANHVFMVAHPVSSEKITASVHQGNDCCTTGAGHHVQRLFGVLCMHCGFAVCHYRQCGVVASRRRHRRGRRHRAATGGRAHPALR